MNKQELTSLNKLYTSKFDIFVFNFALYFVFDFDVSNFIPH